MQNALYNKKRLSTCWSMLLLAAWLGGVATVQTVYRTGPVEGFRDDAKHYRDGSGRTDYECYTPEQTVGIADNVLLYQRANGGWLANWDPLRVLAPEEAVRRGDARILRLQVVVDGTPAVWAGQYDRQTLQPTQGRCFELPGLVSAESVEVVRCLMSIEPPAPEMVRAIEGLYAGLNARRFAASASKRYLSSRSGTSATRQRQTALSSKTRVRRPSGSVSTRSI